MTDIKLLNDPEYRWYHKEEMSKIMPFPSQRKRLGVTIIDYEKLRSLNDEKIKLCKDRYFDWERLKFVVDSVPSDYDKSGVKKPFTPKDRLHFERRDKGCCFICVCDTNVITLCVHCHQVVHQLLYLQRKCKYGRPL